MGYSIWIREFSGLIVVKGWLHEGWHMSDLQSPRWGLEYILSICSVVVVVMVVVVVVLVVVVVVEVVLVVVVVLEVLVEVVMVVVVVVMVEMVLVKVVLVEVVLVEVVVEVVVIDSGGGVSGVVINRADGDVIKIKKLKKWIFMRVFFLS